MLFRIVGILMIVIVCGLYGFLMKYNYMIRIRYLEEFYLLLENLKNEIRYKNSTLRENLLNINRQPYYMKFLNEVTQGLNEGQALGELWSSCCHNNLNKAYLKTSDLEAISNFGKELGIADRETQIAHIIFFQETLRENLKELKNEKKERCRLYGSLGIMGGMFVGILLI